MFSVRYGVLCCAVLAAAAVRVSAEDRPLVVTPRGPVRGTDEGSYTTFFGIPYARVREENPFGVSAPHPVFTEPFEATNATTKCPQAFFVAEGTLQCLRLNIYVPKNQGNKKLPVFVWFHGGGFFFGSAGQYDGKYLVKQDIIVVTANYRMGPYGFFCLDDPEVPGNQGLKDQTDALKWVKDNIAAFGGDATKITIAGESYGGGSVDLHLYSNYEKYFDKAIVQSGAILDEAMFVKANHKAAIELAKLFNHTATNNQDALKFLAKLDPLELMIGFNSSDLLLRACKEKKFKNVQSFVTDDPYHLHNPKKVKDTPVLFGYNSKETFEVASYPEEFFETNKELIFDKLNSTLNLKNKELRELADTVQRFYLGSKPVSKENVLAVVDFLSDFILNFAAENSVTRMVDQGAKVYKYLFSYIGNSPYKNITGVGAVHTEELQYLFIFDNIVVTEPEHVLMRDKMTTLWSNFVKYGNPTPKTTSLLPVLWTPVPKGSRPYMNIDQEMSMGQDVYHQRIAFWDLLWQSHWRNARVLG